MKHLPEKDKKFVKEYAKNCGNGTKAALKAYKSKTPKQASTVATRKLKNPTILEALQKELKKQGITLGSAIAPIAKGLVAKKRDLKLGELMFDENGEPLDDLDVQLKASDRALKLLLPKDSPDINFNLHIDSANFGGEFVREGEIVK